MVNQRKEPTLSTASKSSGGASKSSAPASTPRPKQSVRPQVIVQKQSSGLLWFTLLIALGAAAAVGYTFWAFYNSQQIITEQQARIDELEDKLLLSDDESTQSLTALTANVKGLDKDVKLSISEVDKLWATRKATRKEIADTKKQLDTKIKEATKKLGSVEGTLTPLRQRSSEQELLIQSLRERVSEQNQTLQSLSATSKQYAAATKKMNTLSKELNSVSQKLKGYDETVESFDKFRVTTNRDLIVLKERAGVLAKPQ